MWTEGKIEHNGAVYSYCCKHFEEPSEFGIEGGRVSKLDIRRKGKEVLNYDRGWDIEPVDEDAKQVLEIILKTFN